MTNEDSQVDDLDFQEIVDTFHEEYMIDNENESSEIINEGAGVGELIYKWHIARALHEEDDDDIPYGWSIEAMTLVRLNNDILEKVDDWKTEDEARRWELSLIISDDVVLFYTLANEVIHGISGELLNEEIVSDERRNNASLKMAKSLPQEIKEDLLYYSGIIDNGVKSEMANVRKTRNRLIHELRNRHYLTTIENVESQLERSFKVMNDLQFLKNGVHYSVS